MKYLRIIILLLIVTLLTLAINYELFNNKKIGDDVGIFYYDGLNVQDYILYLDDINLSSNNNSHEEVINYKNKSSEAVKLTQDTFNFTSDCDDLISKVRYKKNDNIYYTTTLNPYEDVDILLTFKVNKPIKKETCKYNISLRFDSVI